MAKTFKLRIVTPMGEYLSREVEYLEVHAEHSVLGILPGHAPLVSTLTIDELKFRTPHHHIRTFAISGGILYVKKDETIVLANTIENSKDIDLDRAMSSRERALRRLEEAKRNRSSEVDIIRAEASLARALNRINVAGKK